MDASRINVCAGISCLLAVLIILQAEGQTPQRPFLERLITLQVTQEPIEAVLKKVSEQAGFTFSYSPDVIGAKRTITLSVRNKTVREVLDQLFNGTLQYKERSRYIILTQAEVSSSSKDPKIFSGYVVDEATGERLKNVSVYDPVTLSSAVTDAYGYFQLEINKPTGEEIRLAINKRNYTDTLVVVSSAQEPRLLNIPIRINTDKIATVADSVGEKLKRFWISTRKATIQAINMENIEDSLYRKFQFSLVPFVGTNGKLSGNVVNDFSVNLFGGYSLGVRKFEMGGLFNITGGNAEGVQAAGLFNGVTGNRRGVQLAGLVNATRGASRGAQFAGLVNFNWEGSEGVAGAGLINMSLKDSRGGMFAGLGNFTHGKQRGGHLAGLFNFSTNDAGPAQLAGLFNFTAARMKGAQIAGLFNIAGGEVQGAQVAGLINVAAKRIRGTQVGYINVAQKVKGTQIGFLNISDSITGIPLGFLSIVEHGYHKIELSADEVFYTNVAFRTGVRQFYNILMAGARPSTFEQEKTVWTFGYGVGTAPRLNRWLDMNIDLTAQQIVWGNEVEAVNLLNKAFVGFDVHATPHFSVAFGITLNMHLTETNYTDYPSLVTDYQPRIFHTSIHNDKTLNMWWGAKVGLRFL